MSIPFQPSLVFVDVAGRCQLRCPSCPVGNSPSTARTNTFMDQDTFAAVVDKAVSLWGTTPALGLFSWGEPLLHPDLDKLIVHAKAAGLRVWVSSNLNLTGDLRPLVRAKPTQLRISLSGYFQETYARTHRGGDVRTVRANMLRLKVLMDRLGSFPVHVAYHLYKHNGGGDRKAMEALCAELGFMFEPVTAFLMPVEANLDWQAGTVSEDIRALGALMLAPPDQMMAWGQSVSQGHCTLRDEQITINADGSVALCCGHYDPKHDVAASFLDADMAALQAVRQSHNLCGACMAAGIHAVLDPAHGAALEGLAEDT